MQDNWRSESGIDVLDGWVFQVGYARPTFYFNANEEYSPSSHPSVYMNWVTRKALHDQRLQISRLLQIRANER